MLGLCRERCQMHSPQGQHDAPRRPAQRSDGSREIGHRLPPVAQAGLPGGARQRQQRHAGLRAGRDGVAAHLRGKRMGGIDEVRHTLVAQIPHQPGHAAEAAHAHGDGLRPGLGHPAGIRQHSAFATFGQGQRERAGFQRAAEDKDVAHG